MRQHRNHVSYVHCYATVLIAAQALIILGQSKDPDTQRFALQTLELLAIESSDMICAQSELLDLLLEIPAMTVDTKVYILAGKILLYYAENLEVSRFYRSIAP